MRIASTRRADSAHTEAGAPGESEIEVTPAMIEAGVAVIFSTEGVAPLGVHFAADELAVEVYRAMDARRLAR